MLKSVLDRLEETVDHETAALLARNLTSLFDFNKTKSAIMRDLAAVLASAEANPVSAADATRMNDIRSKLEMNFQLLGDHLRAAHEVREFLSAAAPELAPDRIVSESGSYVDEPA